MDDCHIHVKTVAIIINEIRRRDIIAFIHSYMRCWYVRKEHPVGRRETTTIAKCRPTIAAGINIAARYQKIRRYFCVFNRLTCELNIKSSCYYISQSIKCKYKYLQLSLYTFTIVQVLNMCFSVSQKFNRFEMSIHNCAMDYMDLSLTQASMWFGFLWIIIDLRCLLLCIYEWMNVYRNTFMNAKTITILTKK